MIVKINMLSAMTNASRDVADDIVRKKVPHPVSSRGKWFMVTDSGTEWQTHIKKISGHGISAT